MVGWFCGLLFSSATCPRPLGGWKKLYERRFGETLEGPVLPFGACSTLRGERRNFPNSTEIHWCEPYWGFLACRRNSHYWMKNLPQDVCGPGGGLRRFKQLPDLAMRGRKVGPTCQKQLGGRSRRGLLKWNAKDRQPEERKAFNPSIRKMESTEKPSKREAKCGDSYGGGNAFANWKQRSAQRSCGQA